MAVGRTVTPPVERSLGHAGGAVGRSVTPVEQVWENWLKLTLAFCCGPDPIKNSGPISKEVAKRCEERKSSIKIYWDCNEDCIRHQQEFRRVRTISRARNLSRSSSLDILPEGNEDRTRWLRIAACTLLQTYVRALRAADDDCPRPPAYMREDYSPPDEEELERRISNLKTRFPDVPRDELLTELNARHGHAGYAAAALLRKQKRIFRQSTAQEFEECDEPDDTPLELRWRASTGGLYRKATM